MNEIRWLPIAETNGRYEVSEDGQVRVIGVDAAGRYRYMGKVLKHCIQGHGYSAVSLAIGGGKRVNRLVHNLVAKAFLGLPPPGHQCNHKDGNKTNPHLSNLEYVTVSQNYRHALEVLGHQPVYGEAHWRAVLTDEKIQRFRERRAEGELLKVLAKEAGVTAGLMSRICTGRSWEKAPGPLTRSGRFGEKHQPRL